MPLRASNICPIIPKLLAQPQAQRCFFSLSSLLSTIVPRNTRFVFMLTASSFSHPFGTLVRHRRLDDPFRSLFRRVPFRKPFWSNPVTSFFNVLSSSLCSLSLFVSVVRSRNTCLVFKLLFPAVPLGGSLLSVLGHARNGLRGPFFWSSANAFQFMLLPSQAFCLRWLVNERSLRDWVTLAIASLRDTPGSPPRSCSSQLDFPHFRMIFYLTCLTINVYRRLKLIITL